MHQDVVADVIAIFDQLHRQRYPIAKMRDVDHYPGAEDELSMEDNNTSAFNCRPLPSGRAWSLHAYGRAIDVNPLLNPYIDSGGNLRAQDRRAVPRPQPHRSRDAARRRPRRPRLHRSRLALGRRLANTEGLSAFRAPLGTHIECSAGSPSGTTNDAPVWTGASGRGDERHDPEVDTQLVGGDAGPDVAAAVVEVPDVRILRQHRGDLVARVGPVAAGADRCRHQFGRHHRR